MAEVSLGSAFFVMGFFAKAIINLLQLGNLVTGEPKLLLEKERGSG